MVEARNGDLQVSVLLGLGVGTEDQIALRKSHHEIEHEGGDHDHDHDEFESFVVELGALEDASAFVAALKPIIDRHDILRLKGFAEVKGGRRGSSSRRSAHASTPISTAPGAAEVRGTRLVVIGLHDEMDDAAIVRDIGRRGRAHRWRWPWMLGSGNIRSRS